MADSGGRVISLGPQGPDSSGAGKMLFDMLQKTQATESDVAKKDAVGAIEDKYQAQADERKNAYQVGMENLRSKLRINETEQTWAHQQQLQQQEAGGLEQLVGQTQKAGVDMGPMVSQQGQVPEAGYGGETVPNKINPNALTENRSLFGSLVKQHLDQQAKVSGINNEATKNTLLRNLDLVDENDARGANSMADAFDAAGDKAGADMIRKTWGTAGQNSHEAWIKFQEGGATRLQAVQATNASKLAISREITQRNKDVAGIRAEAQKILAAGKVDDKTIVNLQRIHSSYQSQIQRYSQMHQRLQEQQMITTDPMARLQLGQQLTDLDEQMQKLSDEAAQIREKMNQYKPASAANPGAPVGAPAPATPPVTNAPPPKGAGGWGKAQRVK